ncbi:MAG: T9SS type A sorting domain-containing protein [Saprospiraceae bacterium]|nr:T9SS type A sorting domain-containing protein [Saprospiraceae bacterium]
MKKVTLLSGFCFFVFHVFAQTPFTITADNFPVYSTENYRSIQNPVGANLTPSPNGSWDFSSLQGGNATSNYFTEETDPFYLDAGVDVYIDNFKALNANVGYLLFDEYDFNENGVEDKGVYVNEQAYGLGAMTGNPADSMKFPFQGAIFPQGRKIIQFPATYQSAWHSASRRVINFTMKVAAAGLNNTPCQHIYTIFRSDSISGWGKMRIHTGEATSIEYNVLIHRVNQYAIDSFFIAGAPAPAAILAAFGIMQGQQTGFVNRYSVYREGFSRPLAIFQYGTNNFTTPTRAVFDTEDLTATTGVLAPNALYSTMLFPNPASTGQLTLQFMGNVPATSDYTVVDIQGKTVQQGTAVLENGALNLQLQEGLPNGNYVLSVLGDKKQTLLTETFVLARQ